MARSKWKRKHKNYTVRSGFEKKVAAALDKKNVSYEYESEKLTYTIPACSRTYTPDFIITTENGHKIYCESKGRFTAADRKKMSLVIEQNPDLDIRMLFMLDNTLSKSSKTTYSMWSEKRGIKAHVSKEGEIPQEWLEEKPNGKSETST